MVLVQRSVNNCPSGLPKRRVERLGNLGAATAAPSISFTPHAAFILRLAVSYLLNAALAKKAPASLAAALFMLFVCAGCATQQVKPVSSPSISTAGVGASSALEDESASGGASTEGATASSVSAPASSAVPSVQTEPSITYLGQASVRIVTPEGKVIYVDPYAGKDAWYDPPADLILVTHEHFDHNGLDKVVNRAGDCVVITQSEAVVNDAHPTFDFGFATVVPVQAGFNALHDTRKCVGYVVELTGGMKVYLTGDTSTTDSMRDGTLADMRIDYAFWCTDGVYNMGNAEAAEAARMVGAAHNIPYHNDTSNSGAMFDQAAAAEFAAPNAMVVLPGEGIAL